MGPIYQLVVTMDEGPRRLVSIGTESVVRIHRSATFSYAICDIAIAIFATLQHVTCYIGYETRSSPEFLLCALRLKSGITPMHANAP